MGTFQLTVQAAVHGYHIYKDIWTPAIGEEFVCRHEWGNKQDKHML